MRLPIDTTGLVFTLISVQPVTEYETKRQATDRESGLPLFAAKLFALAAAAEDGEVIVVKVAGQPPGLIPGGQVRLNELTAQPWAIGDKNGVAFRASAVEPAVAARNGSGG